MSRRGPNWHPSYRRYQRRPSTPRTVEDIAARNRAALELQRLGGAMGARLMTKEGEWKGR